VRHFQRGSEETSSSRVTPATQPGMLSNSEDRIYLNTGAMGLRPTKRQSGAERGFAGSHGSHGQGSDYILVRDRPQREVSGPLTKVAAQRPHNIQQSSPWNPLSLPFANPRRTLPRQSQGPSKTRILLDEGKFRGRWRRPRVGVARRSWPGVERYEREASQMATTPANLYPI
jgi:hypothetical protein